jgi:hypothetical protein
MKPDVSEAKRFNKFNLLAVFHHGTIWIFGQHDLHYIVYTAHTSFFTLFAYKNQRTRRLTVIWFVAGKTSLQSKFLPSVNNAVNWKQTVSESRVSASEVFHAPTNCLDEVHMQRTQSKTGQLQLAAHHPPLNWSRDCAISYSCKKPFNIS